MSFFWSPPSPAFGVLHDVDAENRSHLGQHWVMGGSLCHYHPALCRHLSCCGRRVSYDDVVACVTSDRHDLRWQITQSSTLTRECL